jgi:hypothetical protein
MGVTDDAATRADDPAPLDHYRADPDGPLDPGVYRVVGRDDGAVTLLRVAEDGRRVHSGAVVQLPREDLDALAPAGNPDTGWGRLRQAPSTLAERPLYAGLGLLLVAYGVYELAVAGDDGGLFLVVGGAVILWMLLR